MNSSDAPSIWQGDTVRLRAVEPTDWDVFLRWNQDDDVTRGIDRIWFPQSKEAVRRWAEEASLRKPDGYKFHLVMENPAGAPVGMIAAHSCERRCGTFGYGVNVLREYRRQSYASDAIQIVLRYFFGELGYQKVTVPVHGFNDASIQLHEKLGFVREGCLRRMVFTAGQYFDELYYGLTKEEFQGRHGRQGEASATTRPNS
jgi:RimJ/RimL family protein N-acetyltransferase